jgi:adenylate kinase
MGMGRFFFVTDLFLGISLWSIIGMGDATAIFSNIFHTFPFARKETLSSQLSSHLLILGPPCSGKGTQCEVLNKKYNLLHISTGDLLRSPKYSKYHDIMKSGKLLPDDLVTKIVIQRLQEKDCRTNGWVLDGFPRTLKQAQLLSKFGPPIDAVLFLNVSDEVVLDRGLHRCLDPVTGLIYHRQYNPPPVQIRHRIIERSDDTKHTLLHRLDEFKNQANILSQFYQGKIHQIDSMRTTDEVNKDIEKILIKLRGSQN